MTERATISAIDYDGERSAYGYNTQDFESDGSNFAAVNQEVADFANAWSVVQLIDAVAYTGVTFGLKQSQSPSSDPLSQREAKWLVTYQDVTTYLDDPLNTVVNPGYGKIFNLEIPCAKWSIRDNHSETIYTVLEGGVNVDVDFAVSETERIIRSPYGGNVEVIDVRSVGRNT